MRTLPLPLSSKLQRSSVVELRAILSNLLFIIAVSSLLLLLYLKKIIFDF